MINRFPGLTPTRSRAVVHDGLVFTVAVAPDPVTPSMYEQSCESAGADRREPCTLRNQQEQDPVGHRLYQRHGVEE